MIEIKVAERILKLDAGDRFELPMHLAYETGVVTTLPAILFTLLKYTYAVFLDGGLSCAQIIFELNVF